MYTNFILSIVVPEHHKFMVIHDQASYGIKLKAESRSFLASKNCRLPRLTAWQVLALWLALSFDLSIGRRLMPVFSFLYYFVVNIFFTCFRTSFTVQFLAMEKL